MNQLKDNAVLTRILKLHIMDWSKNTIGENAGIVWRALRETKQSWKELQETTGLEPLALASAIGWLSREEKIFSCIADDTVYFEIVNNEYYF